MSVADEMPKEPAGDPAYGRFNARLRAAFIDTILLLLAMAIALLVASSARSDDLARPLGFALAAAVLLYEPLLVWRTGGTIGHLRCNLRVVDDRTHGNISFAKAAGRFAIKSVLGWYSFISMAVTRRHQAVHDLLTGSTVQVRDAGRARARDFVGERIAGADPAMPSRLRRFLVVCAYLLGSWLISGLAATALAGAGQMSMSCLDGDRCSPRETLWAILLLGLWLGTSVPAIILGQQGRLWGCRAGRRD